VDLIVKVKDEAPKLAETPYKINKIIVYPNYSIGSDSVKTDLILLKKIQIYP
jgi:hypothetical protein